MSGHHKVLMRWLGSTKPEVLAGTATFTAGGESVAVSLCSFEDARAIGRLIEAAQKMAGDDARRACAQYMRAAADDLTQGQR